MVGNQFGFNYTLSSELLVLFKDINIRLAEYLSRYNLANEEIIYIQVTLRTLDKKVYSDLIIDKDSIKDSTYTERKSVMDLISIPTATATKDLGSNLPVVLDDNFNIKEVILVVNDINFNFMDKIIEKAKYLKKNHRDQITNFDKDYKFNYIKGNTDYILAVKDLGNGCVDKLKYSLTGVLLSRIVDKFSGDSLIRNLGSENIYIENKVVTRLEKYIKFNSLEGYKVQDYYWLSNPNIGSIDIETYLNKDNVHEIYALGFRTHLIPDPVVYYIDESLDSSIIVLSLINELLRPKYDKITFYCHNFGGYDVIFILKIINSYNDLQTTNEKKYKLSPLLREDKVIKLTIRKDGKSLIILDSYCMLTSSLDKLGKDFGVETQKSLFPYKFSSDSHLFYKGHTPGIHYYNDISIDKYREIYKEDWDFKVETIRYLKDDLNCLYEIMISANKQVHNDYKINIMDATTISGLAMKIYLSRYYRNNIPQINKPSIYKDLKQAYYGGITEVYRPYGENLFYYDVNSLYPFASLNDMPGLWPV